MAAPDTHEPFRTVPCGKCTGVNGAHYLHCATLRLSPGWYDRAADEG